MVNQPLSISTTVALTETDLILTYEVENRAARDVYLLNRLYTLTPRFTFNRNLVYIYFMPETSTIWLNKKLPSIPLDRSLLTPFAPYVTPVRAGERFAERVEIPMPLEERKPYEPWPLPAAPAQAQTYRHLYFTVGYYWSVKGIREETRDIGGAKALIPLVPAGRRLECGELSGPVHDLNVQVLKRHASRDQGRP